NVLAAYLVPGILLCLAAIMREYPARSVRVWTLLALSLSALFALTFSRGALVNLAVGIVILLIVSAVKRKHVIRISIVAGIAIVLASAVWIGPAHELLVWTSSVLQNVSSRNVT